jgi:hypothetical protein
LPPHDGGARANERCQRRAAAVGAGEQCRWNFNAKCFGRGEVDRQLEFSREFDREVAGLFAFENPADVDAGAAKSI